MKSYIYKCSDCSKEFPAEVIENSPQYLCSVCGSWERNKPLKGVLLVKYDYLGIKKKLKRHEFLHHCSGKFWLYPELWPVNFSSFSDAFLDRISLPSNQLLKYDSDKKSLWVMDETRNPTLSYKDRASLLVTLKALELGITEISAASTGNAGSSLAGICARLGIKSHIFVPSSIPETKRIQIQSFGANIYLVEGTYDDAFDLCLEVSATKKWYNRNTAYNPLTIEGKKSAAYDIFISSKGKLPDVIFIPVGDGVIISGIYKGFAELQELGWIDKLPKLIAVQADGSDALVRYLEKNIFDFVPAKTIADSISAGAPRNLYMAADAVKSTNGTAISVSDEEILSAQKELAQKFGIIAEPSSAATLAGFKKINEAGHINPDEIVMLLITGNGLKDSGVLNRWNKKPSSRSYSAWKDMLSLSM
jgi:threonine synthase